jgi:hypothetical protein
MWECALCLINCLALRDTASPSVHSGSSGTVAQSCVIHVSGCCVVNEPLWTSGLCVCLCCTPVPLQDCWAQDPAARPSMEEVVTRLEKALADGDLEAMDAPTCGCTVS